MGPLAGITVVEITGLGPGPFCGMVLADLGADVVTVDRAALALGASPESVQSFIYARGRRSVGVDLKSEGGAEVVLRLIEQADVFIDPFRPGVAERLGVGPEVCLERNPPLIYGRMTGYGQEGPLSQKAGHDIDYLAVAGALAHIGRRDAPPTPPLNLVADFGGGGMLLALGICAALVERATSGQGQVIDAAMVDGVALLGAPIYPGFQGGYFNEERGTNWLDSGAPYYDAYECADGQYLAVGAIEPKFYAELLVGLGIDGEDLPEQDDESAWPAMKERFAAILRGRTRDEWVAHFADLDACVAPVLSMTEVAGDDHIRARNTYVEVDGVSQPAPAPRFSRTPATLDRPPAPPGHHTDEVLTQAGFAAEEITMLRETGTVA